MRQAREVMDRATEAILSRDNEADNEALKALYAPDAVVETPDQGTLNGGDALVAYMDEFREGFSDLGWEEIHGWDDGDHRGPRQPAALAGRAEALASHAIRSLGRTGQVFRSDRQPPSRTEADRSVRRRSKDARLRG